MNDLPLRLGLDLVEVVRIREAIDRWGERFFDRIFVPGELRRDRLHAGAFAEHVAGRWAAKEAAMKALGTGWRGVAFRDFVIGREASGRPRLTFEGKAARIAAEIGVVAAEVTITHTGVTAAAVVALMLRG